MYRVYVRTTVVLRAHHNLTAVGVLSSVGHREQVLVPVLQLKAGGLVLELSAVDALAACAVAFLEVSPLALQKRKRRCTFETKIQHRTRDDQCPSRDGALLSEIPPHMSSTSHPQNDFEQFRWPKPTKVSMRY